VFKRNFFKRNFRAKKPNTKWGTDVTEFKVAGRPSNEIYSVGFILSFIFTGKEAPHVAGAKLGAIVRKCTDLTVENRYTGSKK
jgi:transposase InsO family protein